jgi:hypothetical protein
MFIGFDSQEKQLVSERHIGKIHWPGVFTCRSYWSSICDYRPSYRHGAPGALWILKPQLSAHTKVNNIQPNNRS